MRVKFSAVAASRSKHQQTATWGPVHTYPDKFENG